MAMDFNMDDLLATQLPDGNKMTKACEKKGKGGSTKSNFDDDFFDTWKPSSLRNNGPTNDFDFGDILGGSISQKKSQKLKLGKASFMDFEDDNCLNKFDIDLSELDQPRKPTSDTPQRTKPVEQDIKASQMEIPQKETSAEKTEDSSEEVMRTSQKIESTTHSNPAEGLSVGSSKREVELTDVPAQSEGGPPDVMTGDVDMEAEISSAQERGVDIASAQIKAINLSMEKKDDDKKEQMEEQKQEQEKKQEERKEENKEEREQKEKPNEQPEKEKEQEKAKGIQHNQEKEDEDVPRKSVPRAPLSNIPQKILTMTPSALPPFKRKTTQPSAATDNQKSSEGPMINKTRQALPSLSGVKAASQASQHVLKFLPALRQAPSPQVKRLSGAALLAQKETSNISEKAQQKDPLAFSSSTGLESPPQTLKYPDKSALTTQPQPLLFTPSESKQVPTTIVQTKEPEDEEFSIPFKRRNIPASLLVQPDDEHMKESSEFAAKADEHSRDLEKMFNNLKKRHEAAKDLLVRALVNNNMLQMLNNPINEDKITETRRSIQEVFLSHSVSSSLEE